MKIRSSCRSSMSVPTIVLLGLLLFLRPLGVAGQTGEPKNPVRIGVAYNAVQSAALKKGRNKNSSYINALESVGAKAVLLRIDDEPRLFAAKLAGLDGLLLPGGGDIAPARYGELPHPKLETVDEPFDAFEFGLLQLAHERQLPILGICRGHQLLNVFLGGSLYQDIPSQVSADTTVMHRKRENEKNGFCEHPVWVATDSAFFAIVGVASLTVNTFHHQGVKALGHGLRISATTADGIAEVIEGTGPGFVLGVQFHPERDARSQPAMKRIFSAFVAAARHEQTRSASFLVPGTKSGGYAPAPKQEGAGRADQ